MNIKSGEIIFIKCVKDGIPNRDPLNDSNARRIFGEDDGRISLSDVSIKRDVRDYVTAKYPDGGSDRNKYIYVREERTEDGKLLGRASLADRIKERSGNTNAKMQSVLTSTAFDVRTFGIVYSVRKESFKITGPVQFGWAHSMHPVETQYVQGTVVMPSDDIKNVSDGADEGSKQGTIWTTYTLPFAVFVMPGIINANIAKESGMSSEDMELLLEALWNGTKHRQARGRGIQQPLYLLHVEYRDPLYRIGYLEESVKLDSTDSDYIPDKLDDVELDVSDLCRVLNENHDRIHRTRYWMDPRINLIGNTLGQPSQLW